MKLKDIAVDISKVFKETQFFSNKIEKKLDLSGDKIKIFTTKLHKEFSLIENSMDSIVKEIRTSFINNFILNIADFEIKKTESSDLKKLSSVLTNFNILLKESDGVFLSQNLKGKNIDWLSAQIDFIYELNKEPKLLPNSIVNSSEYKDLTALIELTSDVLIENFKLNKLSHRINDYVSGPINDKKNGILILNIPSSIKNTTDQNEYIYSVEQPLDKALLEIKLLADKIVSKINTKPDNFKTSSSVLKLTEKINAIRGSKGLGEAPSHAERLKTK